MFNLDRFKNLCNKTGVKQTALFAMVGKPRSYSSDLKKIKNVPAEFVEVWAKALQTTPEYLMGETDDPSIKKEPAPAGRLDGKRAEIMEILGALPDEQLDFVLERCRTLAELNRRQEQ